MATDAPKQSSAASLPQGSPATANTGHRCYICSRSYERPDHLSRHLKSHDNERSYQCPDCDKGFNRADLLNRHRTAHVKNAGETFRRRTGRACEACIKAKTKCEEERPCKRCKTRDQPCEESEGRSRSRPLGSRSSPLSVLGTNDDQRLTHADNNQQSVFSHGADGTLSVNGNQSGQLLDTQQPTPRRASGHEDANLLLGLNDSTAINGGTTTFGGTPSDLEANGFTPDDVGFSDFFGQIMMPQDATASQSLTAMPFDVSDFTQDLSFDSCDFDFSFLASGLTQPPTAQGFYPEAASTTWSDETPQSDAQLRSEAFSRSPWSWDYWLPERNSHAFSGQDEIDVQEDRVDATDQMTSPDTTQFVHCAIDQAARDRMIRTVTQVAHQRLAMPSFPSLKLLEDLVDVFLIQDSNATDSYIHAASFQCRETRTELLLAMVAAGARHVALAPVWKMGLVIQEVVRLAVAEAFERDNSATRELQVLQAMLLWLDIGVFSGFRRKTEIALSFLQPLVTMLSWSHAFQRPRYQVAMPAVGDNDTVLSAKWKAWAEQESFKRLVIHTFMHDSQVAIVNMRNPLLSAAQMHLPLPATRELWLAPNAHVWAKTYYELKLPFDDDLPSLTEFFGNIRKLEQLGKTIDKPLSMLAACHGLGHEVWMLRQHARLLCGWRNQGRRDRWLAHQTQQRDLYDDLSTFSAYCELQDNAPPEIMLTIELLMMSLHVDLEDVQTFSGKSGEEEARKVFPRIRAWTEDGEARTAVRHAGQVFRVARTFEKTTLRDFYAVAFYHAALTLWVYGMVTSNATHNSGVQTPQHATLRSWDNAAIASAPAPRTLVDASDEKSVRAFSLLGQGTPGIRSAQHSGQAIFVPLSESKHLMSTAATLLKSNFPQSSNGLPPLIENLANLMSELGRLSGKDQTKRSGVPNVHNSYGGAQSHGSINIATAPFATSSESHRWREDY
ncbi:hypothetical protein LTR08_002553 [Meristemomyces frigidus]|nr:hypothetical protein LTR08_002553 [Meristemomyces frigidus]